MAAAATHYSGFRDQIKELVKNGWNEKKLDVLPKLGSEKFFSLAGREPSLVRQFKGQAWFKGKVIAVNWAPATAREDAKLNSRLVVGDQGGNVLILDAKKGARRGGYTLMGPAKFVQAVAVHGEKDLVVSGGMDNTISMYAEGSSDDGRLEKKKSWFGEIKLWDISKSEAITTFYGHSDEACGITQPRDRDVAGTNVFATCSNDTTVRIWDMRERKCTLSLHAAKPEDKLQAADFFPNGNAIAAGGQGQTTYMWDIRSVKQIAAFKRNNMKVTGVAFSKSGRALYVSHEDGRIIIWDTFGPQENQKYACKHDAHFDPLDLKNPKSGAAPTSQITYIGLKPDGEFLASASFNAEVKVWGGLKDPSSV